MRARLLITSAKPRSISASCVSTEASSSPREVSKMALPRAKRSRPRRFRTPAAGSSRVAMFVDHGRVARRDAQPVRFARVASSETRPSPARERFRIRGQLAMQHAAGRWRAPA